VPWCLTHILTNIPSTIHVSQKACLQLFRDSRHRRRTRLVCLLSATNPPGCHPVIIVNEIVRPLLASASRTGTGDQVCGDVNTLLTTWGKAPGTIDLTCSKGNFKINGLLQS
jgi:hypothetical protein